MENSNQYKSKTVDVSIHEELYREFNVFVLAGSNYLASERMDFMNFKKYSSASREKDTVAHSHRLNIRFENPLDNSYAGESGISSSTYYAVAYDKALFTPYGRVRIFNDDAADRTYHVVVWGVRV